VSVQLNHSSVDVTSKHYAHLLPQDNADRIRAALD